MLKYIITLLIINVVFIGCHQSVKSGIDNHSKITINLKDTLTKFSQIFDEVQYIPLETNINCNLGNIHKVQICKNIIYVCDQDANLYMFDITGKYIKTIGGNGRGPGERRGLSDFFVDKKGEGIEVFDCALGRLTRYNLKGDYLWDKKVPFYSYFFVKKDTSTYVFYNNNNINIAPQNLYITDNNLNIIKTHIQIFAPGVHYAELFPLATDEHNVLFSSLYDKNIYTVDHKGDISIKWEFDFAPYNIPYNLIEQFNTNYNDENRMQSQSHNYAIDEQISENYAQYIQKLQKCGSWVYFNYVVATKLVVHCLINEKTDKVHLLTSEIEDDMNGLFLARLGYDFVDQSMVGVTYPFLLKKYRGNKYKSIEALKNVGESDNPIVVIYKLKNDEKLTN